MSEISLQTFSFNRSNQQSTADIETNMADIQRDRGLKRVGRHYVLLLWKNYVLAKRAPIRTFLEIILPVFFAFLLLGIRYVVKSDNYTNATIFESFDVDSVPPYTSTISPSVIAYTPNNTDIATWMKQAAKRLKMSAEGFLTENALVEAVNKQMPDGIYIGGVVFSRVDATNITYKLRFSAKLRNSGAAGVFNGDSDWKTNLLYPVFPVIGPRNPKNATGGTPGYYQEGFLAVQRAIDLTLIEVLNTTFNSSSVNIRLQRYPFPPYKADNFVLIIQVWFPFLLVMSYIFAAINTVKNIVYEKERGLKIAMSIMGLSNWIHWASWFTRTLIFLTIADLLITICYIVKVPLQNGGSSSVIGESNAGLVFFFLFSYSVASISFMFLISTIFDKANSSAAGTGGLWFLSYLPYLFIQPRYETMSKGSKLGSCILHNIALSLGAQLIGMFEGKGTGLQWSMFNEPVSVDDNFTMANVVMMLYIDAFIYLLLALYIENIRPGQYGIPKGFLYPFDLNYWRGHTKKYSIENRNAGNSRRDDEDQTAFESEPSDKPLGVQLQNVSKTYTFKIQRRPPVHAVNNLTLNIYGGQLTALLGHNGAGKSTTISMITGLIPPTEGQIIVDGHDIATSMDEVRHVLGLCPQYNILFDQLTVREHLRLFATLKGHPANDIDNEIEKMVTDLMLNDKLDTQSKALSGGMKRKLSVGIALVANSKVVILDEPTSGMDPAARRSTWDMLQRFRMNRTILFTTHFMDEADVLADRIAIMGNGYVRCCGSPFFLKTSYGVGYHLIASKDVHADSDKIFSLVQRYVPEAKLESAISAECKILLPHNASPRFPDLFDAIDKNKNSLQIFSVGLSETTIEEVFMKIVEKDEPDEVVVPGASHSNPSFQHDNAHDHSNGNSKERTVNINTSVFDIEVVKNSQFILFHQRFYALLLKHILNSLRNYLVLVASFLPVLFVFFSMIIEQQIPKPEDSPSLLMTFERYETNYVPFSYDSSAVSSTKFIEAYKNVLLNSTKVPTLIDLTTPSTEPCRTEPNTDIFTYLSCIGSRSLLELSDNYLVGALVSETGNNETLNITGLFNNQPYHIPSMTLNYLSNALLKQHSISPARSPTINVVNHPLPRSASETISDFQTQQFFGFRVSSSIVFGFSFMMASFAVFLIKERVSKAKHLQFLSGAGSVTFWLSTFIWDLAHYLLCTALIFMVWGIFYQTESLKNDLKVFLTGSRVGYTIMLFIFYGFSQIPMTYLITYIFNVPATGFAWITIINIITSQATLLAVAILSIPQLDLLDVARILEWIFIAIFPNYCLGQGLSDIYKNSFLNDLCEPLVPLCGFISNPCCKNNCTDNCVDYTSNYLAWESPGIARFIAFMGIQSFVFFAILICKDRGLFLVLRNIIKGMFSYRSNTSAIRSTNSGNTLLVPHDESNHRSEGSAPFNTTQDDEDVVEEANRIRTTDFYSLARTDVMVLSDVSKIYNGNFRAVDQISVGVKHGECFGLLGVNGAGKTTTFKMITGDETPDDGFIAIDGLNLSTRMRSAQGRMGYCPQFDALIDLMTGEETLYMFARLRGVIEAQIPQIVDALIDLFNLRKHAKKPVYAYSGGNKRKLSAAVSLIGDPAIIFLDEPTTGMDPKARRHFWNAIAQFRDHGKPIILTSHSMEECEALCTRLAIMVNGRFKCLGNIQHLKTKFGAGYTLIAKLSQINQTKVREFFGIIEQSFPNSVLKESYEGYVHIHVNEEDLSLGALFRTIESCKDRYSIENYTVSQTTLEQVFLNFARSQLDPEELRRRIREGNSLKQKIKNCCKSCC